MLCKHPYQERAKKKNGSMLNKAERKKKRGVIEHLAISKLDVLCRDAKTQTQEGWERTFITSLGRAECCCELEQR